jgi:hypothetical protein
MNPIAIAQLTSAVLPFFTTARSPTQAQVDAALAQQRAAERQNWLIGGGLAGAAVLVYLLAKPR